VSAVDRSDAIANWGEVSKHFCTGKDEEKIKTNRKKNPSLTGRCAILQRPEFEKK
jgi:hypothetical protein